MAGTLDLASRISIVCFAASYGIGMVSEIARLFWPSRLARWSATGFGLAGLAAQFLFLCHRWHIEGRLPIVTQFESLIAVSWLISLVYLSLLLWDRQLAAGVFILPVSLGLVLAAAALPEQGLREGRGGQEILLTAHGILLLAGMMFVVGSLVAALMYLVKVHQLRSGTILGTLRLPSLERLERINAVGISVAWPLLTLGILLGFLPNRLQWADPKVVATVGAWLFLTVLLYYRWEHRGRKVAIVTVVACALVLVSVLIDPILGTGHQAAGVMP